MAVIYSYPQVSAVDGTELLLCSQTSNNNATRSMTTEAFGAYIQSTYGPGSNIYQADGTLSGDRTLVGGGNSLTFSGLSLFTVANPVELGSTFKLTTGASLNHVLTSDASGNATWAAPAAGSFIGLTDTPLVWHGHAAGQPVTINPTLDGLVFATSLEATHGGTGINTYAVGDILYADSVSTLTKLIAGTDTHVLTLTAGIPTWAAPAGGVTSVSTDNTLWVAESGGTAHGSRTTEISDPYDTIAGALGDALSGDTVMVLPGTYAESPGTVPAGVSLVSQGGYEVTAITGAAVTGNRITLSSGSVINGFNVTIPSDATNAIEYAGAATTVAGCRFIKFTGQASALGSGLANTGAGKTVAFEVRYGLLDCENILLCSNGILAIQSLHVPGSGTVQRGAKVSGGRLQALDMNIGNANVVYGVETGTSGIAVLISLNLFNLKNGLLVTGNDAQIDALGGKIQTVAGTTGTYPALEGYSVVVDPTIDLSAASIKITAQTEPNFYWNNTTNPNAASSNFAVELSQKTTDNRLAAKRLFGEDSIIGFPERGQQLMTGEGGANATFNTVYQIDTAGVFQADKTEQAASSSTLPSSRFGFNTGIVGDCIAWCSNRRDQYSDYVKHWGLILLQRTASSNTNEYVFEISTGGRVGVSGLGITTPGTGYTTATNVPTSGGSGTGLTVDITAVAGAITAVSANQPGYGYLLSDVIDVVQTGGSGGEINVTTVTPVTWSEVNVEAISVANQYRYANDVFLRAESTEQIRMGIDPDSLWAVTTLDKGGANERKGYWARVRLVTVGGTIPEFYQLKLTPSHTMWNQTGQKTAHGLAMWRNTLFGVGNTWGDGTGGATGMKDTDPTDVSSLNWTQKNKKSRFESAGANNTFQFGLPGGICTAYPIKFNLSVSTPTGSTLTDASITLRALPLKLEGVNSADPSGGIIPIPRLLANATDYTTAVPQVVTLNDETIPLNKVKTTTFSFDISDYYEDDMLLLNIIANNGSGDPLSTADCLDMWTLTIEGVAFTDGKIL